MIALYLAIFATAILVVWSFRARGLKNYLILAILFSLIVCSVLTFALDWLVKQGH